MLPPRTRTATRTRGTNDHRDHDDDGRGEERTRSRTKLSFATKFSLLYSLASLALLVGLSLVFSPPRGGQAAPGAAFFAAGGRRRLESVGDGEQQQDYSSYSCHLIRDATAEGSAERCLFARTCGGGEGLWAPVVFCSPRPRLWTIALSPVMAVWMVVLFRMLGSTAEDFFSPSLEMFSTQLGLPPRFAGVTLLALGNGAADVSATQSAITGDPEHGYQLSLGALTGAAMMIGSVVSAMVILTAGGVPCRGALVRDVTVLLLTVVVVWRFLSTGKVTPETITVFLSFYGVFVMLVFVADMYHRRVVLPRLSLRMQELERQRQLDEAEEVRQRVEQQAGAGPGGSRISNVLTALSNYDSDEVARRMRGGDGIIGEGGDAGTGWGIESDDLEHERPILLHGSHGLLAHAHQHQRQPDNGGSPVPGGHDGVAQHTTYTALEDPPPDGTEMMGGGAIGGENNGDASPFYSPPAAYQPFRPFVENAKDEILNHFAEVWDDIYWNGDVNVVDKVLLTIELPVVVLRKVTVAIPCEGYYVRSLVALALAASPLWVAYYLWRSNEVLVFTSWIFYVYWGLLVVAAFAFAQMAPAADNVRLSPWASVPIALYGFAVAATWIDTIADALVSLLNFVGVLLSIPPSVLGLTLLAWGNSMSDLSADVTMARKGLANMAMTACFAGPVFNILVGLGLGFSSLAAQTGQSEREVVLSPSVLTGFAFVTGHCLCLLGTGVFLCRSRIPRRFGYFSLAIYAAYVVTSISLQYSKYGADGRDE